MAQAKWVTLRHRSEGYCKAARKAGMAGNRRRCIALFWTAATLEVKACEAQLAARAKRAPDAVAIERRRWRDSESSVAQ
jgi:hypothetical protein